tara:strand:+ start:71 stop:1489 length:1419 start_codon:yes stop_codon:yes gene_type:complete
MLGKLRGFSKSKLAGVLVAIIIVPFVFWGMGSVFSGGNTNNVAKINNNSISTQDFVEHINDSRINSDFIKKNLDKNVLEEMLSELVSNKLIEMEINDLSIKLSEEFLAKSIKNNKNFMDENDKFSRIKYEKFLLEQNISAPYFEKRLKDRELKKSLFNYISGGIKSPYFLRNKVFISQNKQIEIVYFDLDNVYDTSLTEVEINQFIKDNEEALKDELIDFSYTIIKPKDLVEIDEFNNEFFKKIDEIENAILNDKSLKEIASIYNLKVNKQSDFKANGNDVLLDEIYQKRTDENIQLVDKNEFFLLFDVEKITKTLPKKNNLEFVKRVKDNLLLKKKFDLNQELFKKIQDKELTDQEFYRIAKGEENVLETRINSINDTQNFDINSLKLIYALPKDSYVLIGNEENKIFLAKISNIIKEDLSKNEDNKNTYLQISNTNIINDIYTSYDISLNSKYKVKVFQNSIDRVKEYFR